MARYFKTMHDARQEYEINKDTAERILGRNYPWYRPQGSEPVYYAVCARCDNPIRLYGIYTGGVPPHGRHHGVALTGFPFFDRASNDFCAYERNAALNKADRREISEFGRKIRRLAIEEFDRVVLVLSHALGINISETLAGEMLRDWLAAGGYLYKGAHLKNIPWMIAYFSRRQSLFGRRIWKNGDLIDAITAREPNAVFNNQTLSKGDAYYSVTFEFIDHRVRHLPAGQIEETIVMRIFGTGRRGGEAPQIFEQSVVFDESRFASLMNTSLERARRDDGMLAVAARVGGQFV